MGHSSIQSGKPTFRSPGIASTIVTPSQHRATASAGGLSKSEKVALAGLASMAGGGAWMGGVMAGASTKGMISGATHKITRDSFDAEKGVGSPVNQNGTGDDITAGIVTRDSAMGPWPAQKREGRWVAMRPEGYVGILPALLPDEDAPVKKVAPMREAARENRATVLEDRTDDMVAELLATMGHKGKITAQLRALALDALEAQRQTADYCAR